MKSIEIKHGHLFCGLGGGAKGFNQAMPQIPGLRGVFRCIGGVDVDPAGIADFKRLTGVEGTVLDLFDRYQYRDFHGHEPPASWREAGIADIHRAFGNERPNVIFLSAPCKGFSGLTSTAISETDKYRALNRLTLRGVMLALEAYRDDPPEMFLFENVPLIATRGRYLLDQITALFRQHGYVVAETTHDCGELGGLAQSRKRFLLVARHLDKVPPFLYEPPKRPLQSVGSVLSRMPLPGDIERGGPMHRIPSLQWKTWVRLAFVEAGSDWRSLNRLAVEDGQLRDFLIVPEYHRGYLGVRRWEEPSGVICSQSRATNGAFSVADPRARAGAAQYQQYGVMAMDDTSGAVIGVKSPGQGTFSVADPRPNEHADHQYRIVALTGAPGQVADPRPTGEIFGKYACTSWSGSTGTVIGRSDSGQGGYSVADPRPQRTGALFSKYPVTPWEGSTATVIGGDDMGAYAVADPRNGQMTGVESATQDLPGERDKLVCRITSLDGTWHRPFTTLERAALQSLVDPEQVIELDGLSDQAWSERIGNAVPPKAAQAIAEEIGRTLLLAWSGQTWSIGHTPIWVRNVAVALALPGHTQEVGHG